MSSPTWRKGRVLVVDDDPGVRGLLDRYLSLDGYSVATVDDGPAVLPAVAARPPDILLLDAMLPSRDGFEVLSDLRRISDVPVIMLTGRDEEANRVLGLRLGADDYLVKPFSADELEARIEAVLRRTRRSSTPAVLEFDGLRINVTNREVTRDGEKLALTAREFDLLVFLASSPRQVFSRGQLLEHVWGSSSEWQDSATVTEHVRRIREKLEPEARHRWLSTVRGVGYRFDP